MERGHKRPFVPDKTSAARHGEFRRQNSWTKLNCEEELLR
jgi:hypothetical protein